MSNEKPINPMIRVDENLAEQLRREAYRQRKTRVELLNEAWADYMKRLKRERGKAGERA